MNQMDESLLLTLKNAAARNDLRDAREAMNRLTPAAKTPAQRRAMMNLAEVVRSHHLPGLKSAVRRVVEALDAR